MLLPKSVLFPDNDSPALLYMYLQKKLSLTGFFPTAIERLMFPMWPTVHAGCPPKPLVPLGKLAFIAPASLKVRAHRKFHSFVADKQWCLAVKDIPLSLATACPACTQPDYPFVPAVVVRLIVSACSVSHELSLFPAIWASAYTSKSAQSVTPASNIVVWPGVDCESFGHHSLILRFSANKLSEAWLPLIKFTLKASNKHLAVYDPNHCCKGWSDSCFLYVLKGCAIPVHAWAVIEGCLQAEFPKSFKIIVTPTLVDVPVPPLSSLPVAWSRAFGNHTVSGLRPGVWCRIDSPALACDAGGCHPFFGFAVTNCIGNSLRARFTGSIGEAELEALLIAISARSPSHSSLVVVTDSEIAWKALATGLDTAQFSSRIKRLARRVFSWNDSASAPQVSIVAVLCESHVGTPMNMLADSSVPSPDSDDVVDYTGSALVSGSYIHSLRWQRLSPKGLADRLRTEFNELVVEKAQEMPGADLIPGQSAPVCKMPRGDMRIIERTRERRLPLLCLLKEWASPELRSICPSSCVLCNEAEETLLHMAYCSALGPPLSGPISNLIVRATGVSDDVSKALQAPSVICALAIGHWPAEISKLLPVATFAIRNRWLVLQACMKEFADRFRQRCRALDNLRASTTNAELKDVLLRLHGISDYSDEDHGVSADHGVDLNDTELPDTAEPLDLSEGDSEIDAMSADEGDEAL